MPSTFAFTWLGHGTFLFESPGGKRIVLDPWITGNPASPEAAKKLGNLDLILVTHGHNDHTGDVIPLARSSGAHVVAPVELGDWFEAKGLKNVTGMNIGGTLKMFGMAMTMVTAVHSSSVTEPGGNAVYTGSASGFVIKFENGLTVYFAGDTAIFADMRLIAELYRPTIAFLPIGDHYTMGPEEAAKACELLAIKQVVPMHYGTFPVLTGTPARLRELVEPHGVQVLELKPGETAS